MPEPGARRYRPWTTADSAALIARVLAPQVAFALGWSLLVWTGLWFIAGPEAGYAVFAVLPVCFLWLTPGSLLLAIVTGVPVGMLLGRRLLPRLGLRRRVVYGAAGLAAVGVVIGGTAVAGLWVPMPSGLGRATIDLPASVLAVVTALQLASIDG